MNQKSKIIGTGLTGLVGSRIVELFGNTYEFVDFSLESGVNILDKSSLESNFVSGTSSIIHLAAFTDTNSAWSQRGDKSGLCYQLNVEGTRNIFELAQKHRLPLIHISTDFVFDGHKSGVYDEDDLPHPIDWYGETKYEAEKIVNGYATILRIAFPYRSQFTPKTDIVRKIMDKLKNNQTITMFKDQTITPTFVDDIAKAIIYFVNNPKPEIFHAVGSSSHSPYDLAKLVAKLFKYDEGLIQSSSLDDYLKDSTSRPYAKNLSLSNHKISSLGLEMKTLSDGLLSLLL